MNTPNITISLKNFSFQVKEPSDFTWLYDFEDVFSVFDQQDSGNICFGVKINNAKKFVKYAGAKTMAYLGKPGDAIMRLKQSISIYQALNHSSLIQLEKHYATKEGYLAIFDWVDGECLHPHWAFTPFEKLTYPSSPFYKFRKLPIHKRLIALNIIFSFVEFVELKGYVAIDLYDGSILYDFKNDITTICDIDFFSKAPIINETGEDFWGSQRFKSPEESKQGGVIDGQTNVYTLAALAFWLIGGMEDHSIEKWDASPKLYEIALKAISENKNERYSTVSEFYSIWRKTFSI